MQKHKKIAGEDRAALKKFGSQVRELKEVAAAAQDLVAVFQQLRTGKVPKDRNPSKMVPVFKGGKSLLLEAPLRACC